MLTVNISIPSVDHIETIVGISREAFKISKPFEEFRVQGFPGFYFHCRKMCAFINQQIDFMSRAVSPKKSVGAHPPVRP